MEKKIGTTTIKMVQGDITNQTTDVIVNAANSQLAHMGGVARVIAMAAGEELQRESAEAPDIATGEVYTTTGGNLDAKYVIHAVGPIWSGGDKDEAKLLSSCITESLTETDRLKCSSISFPAISTGIYGYPLNLAAQTILDAMYSYVSKKTTDLKLVQMVLFSREDYIKFIEVFEGVIDTG